MQEGTPVGKSRIENSRQETTAKFRGTCRVCKNTVYPGDTVYYFPRTHAVEHYNCTRRRGSTTR